MFTKEQIARAALEAGVGVEKIKQMLKLLPEWNPPSNDIYESWAFTKTARPQG